MIVFITLAKTCFVVEAESVHRFKARLINEVQFIWTIARADYVY